MKVQILLRESIPGERELINHLKSMGARSGEPKRLLMAGFLDGAPREKKGGIKPEAANKVKSFVAGG